jgi:hypothetical protein
MEKAIESVMRITQKRTAFEISDPPNNLANWSAETPQG